MPGHFTCELKWPETHASSFRVFVQANSFLWTRVRPPPQTSENAKRDDVAAGTSCTETQFEI